MAKTVSASWPLASLLRSLSMHGWGDQLSGAHMRSARVMLGALTDYLPHGSAEGAVTAWQLAQVSNYSDKWVRHGLELLEELGVITWVRGGIRAGKPQPSFIRVVKKALVRLIEHAKGVSMKARAAHAAATAERIAQQGLINVASRKRGRYSRRSAHAEVASSLILPYRGGRSPHPEEKVKQSQREYELWKIRWKEDQQIKTDLVQPYKEQLEAQGMTSEKAAELAVIHAMKQIGRWNKAYKRELIERYGR